MFSVKKCSKSVPIINRMLIVHKSQCISSGLLGPSTDREEVIKYAKTILRQKIYLLRIVTANDYILRIYPSSSIGAHIRHSLDHFNTILRYKEDPDHLNYDVRNRRGDIEECRKAAIRSCELLIESLDNIRFDEVVKVTFMSDHLTGMCFLCKVLLDTLLLPKTNNCPNLISAPIDSQFFMFINKDHRTHSPRTLEEKFHL